jgi:anti-anti-sigma factor
MDRTTSKHENKYSPVRPLGGSTTCSRTRSADEDRSPITDGAGRRAHDPYPTITATSTVASITHQNGVRATIALRGEIDLANVGQLRDELLMCLERGVTALEVDMTELAFIDCVGISVLAVAFQRLNGRGSVVVRNPPRSAHTILEISGLATMVTIDGASTRRESA